MLFINMLRRQLGFAAHFSHDGLPLVRICAPQSVSFRKICKSTDALLSAARAKGGFRRRHHPFVPGAEAFKKLSEYECAPIFNRKVCSRVNPLKLLQKVRIDFQLKRY